MLSPEEKLLRAIFGEAAGDTLDVSLRAPHENGIEPTSFLIDAVLVLPPDLRPETSTLNRPYAAIFDAVGGG